MSKLAELRAFLDRVATSETSKQQLDFGIGFSAGAQETAKTVLELLAPIEKEMEALRNSASTGV